MNGSLFKEALDYMLQAESQNSHKNKKVKAWFTNEVVENGRASVVNEVKQAPNRVTEQFPHGDPHVVFVYADEKTKESLKKNILKHRYNNLETVLLLQNDNLSVDFSLDSELIIFKTSSKIIDWYKQTMTKLTIDDLSVSSTPHSASMIERTFLPKPFILLAGISGTGKTRFVEKQAEAWGNNDNYCLVPVRPDWHEPSDLLGYISRINGTQYIATDFLKFMINAWINSTQSVTEDSITNKEISEILPYWLCLDEMNLAPVEQYFADYLSILESRKWDGGLYKCKPILSRNLLETLNSSTTKDGINSLDTFWNEIFKDIICDFKDDLCKYFLLNGISIPPNLIVAGTVNMDETTHGFSRKVIDRALTIDFQEFFPNDFNLFFSGQQEPKLLSFSNVTQLNKSQLDAIDVDKEGDNSRSVLFLQQINTILKNTPFQLAYRALNELLLSVYCFQPKDDFELKAIWDDFLMQKILPRIEGDSQKLKHFGDNLEFKLDTTLYGKPSSLLHELYSLLEHDDMLGEVWDGEIRPDLLRETEDKIECRSKKKLKWMMKRLKSNHFTDFWV
jgi:hypothetical protein